MKVLLKCLLGLALMFPLVSMAQETPNHSYQVAEDLNHELDALMAADYIDASAVVDPIQLQNRTPGHVVNRARVVMMKLNQLRWILGMEQRSIPAVPVKAITPSDVKQYLVEARQMAKEVREFYGLPAPTPADLPSGKTPTDVFNHLSLAMQKLFALNVPVIVPNDVYNQTAALYADLEMLLRAKRIDKRPALVPAAGKTPADGYNHAVDVIVAIRQLNPTNTKTPAQIRADYATSHAIGPTEVQNVLGNTLAEMLDLKFALGITTPAITPEPTVGKTPTDVYVQLDQVLRGLEPLQ